MRQPREKVTLRLAAPLREAVGGADEIAIEASDVADLVNQVESSHPGFRSSLFAEAMTLKPDVFVYVNGVDLRSLDGFKTVLKDGDTVAVLNAICGG